MITQDIIDAFQAFVEIIVYVALPFLVVLLVWSGLRFVLAQGNPEAIQEAQKFFLIAIGITAGVLGAWTVVRIAGDTIAGLSTSVLFLVVVGFLAYILTRR